MVEAWNAQIIFRPDSLSNVESQWAGEVKHFCRGVPIVLVGNKADLRQDPELLKELAKQGQFPVTMDQVHWKSTTIGSA